ncbi:non-ribosomal peptide synthetase [Paragemmobacter straminiformis]|uniref:Non-ribosomal peptide synthetase n=1 Tax=Paragemmobacter straminiformis TaxID=2045119 RepID=A0A842I7U8_9RHOB|nr:non-ribosomal peptide synthetase [Gemmobacter straminiformis]MBC2836152.1 non-ribosomal peptide synthetase [Gemmobacter straminiformis]
MSTVLTLLQDAARRAPDAPALIIPQGVTLDYAAFESAVLSLAAGLQAKGFAKRRIAIVLPAGAEMCQALFATAIAGVAVPFNPSSTLSELLAYFSMAGVAAVLTLPQALPAAAEAAQVLDLPLLDFHAVSAPQADARLAAPDPSDLAIVLMTSGTTGRGKLVPLTHANLLAGTREVARSLGLTAQDRVLSMWELHHVGGIVDLLLAPIFAGGSVVASGRFDAQRFFDLLGSAQPTWFQGVPTTLGDIATLARREGRDPRGSSLRFLRSVAAALPAAQLAELEQLFALPVITTFGMTEASPLIASTRLPPALRKPGSAGTPCGTEIAIMDDHGTPLPALERGEVAIRGPNVFTGYENNPEANAESFRNGWFYTGDLGYLDTDGDLFLTGRSKDIINRGGEKIAPQEVDEVALSHPDILHAACFPVPHATLGEDIAIAVVPRAGAALTLRDIKTHIGASLAPFKVPRHLVLVDALPRNPIGKVLRTALTAAFTEQAQAADHPPEGQPERASPLETAVATLWAEELDLPQVGLDDDFAQIGGDSLSSMRLILAVERLTGLRIPDDAVAQIDTVRQMSAFLVTLGATEKPPFRTKADRKDRDALLDAVQAATADRDGFDDTLLQRCTSIVELDIIRHTLENVAPPALLTRLFAASPEKRGWWPFGRTALARRRADWSREVAATLADATDPLAWQRVTVSDNVDLMTDPSVPSNRKTLVIGFTSRAMRLTAPTYQILCALDPAQHDLLLLRDPDRRHYFSGVPGVATSLGGVARWIADWQAPLAYRETVALGTSAGGIPALVVGLQNGCRRILLSGADSPKRHPHFAAPLAQAATRLDQSPETRVTIAFSAGKDRDRDAAADLAALFPRATLAGDPRFDEHPLLYLLHRKGELKPFLRKHLLGP